MTTAEWIEVHNNRHICNYLWGACRSLSTGCCAELYIMAWVHIADMLPGLKDEYYMQQGIGCASDYYQRYRRVRIVKRFTQNPEYHRMKRHVKYYLKRAAKH